MILEIDENNDGEIDQEEFIHMMQKKMCETNAKDELKQAFAVFDKDGNGKISFDELKEVMGKLEGQNKLSDKEIADMIKEADIDGDVEVDFEEFYQMMMA